MIIVNTDREKFISGTCGKENFSIPYDEVLYDALKDIEKHSESAKTATEMEHYVKSAKELIDSYNYQESIATKIPGVVFVKSTGKYHLVIGDGYSDLHIPDSIAKTMIDNLERSIENEPLVNLCRRFIFPAGGPKPTQARFQYLAEYISQTYVDSAERDRLMKEKNLSYEVATEHATYKDMQVTRSGYLSTFKVVEEVLKKWALVRDDSGKIVMGDDGKPKRVLVDRYEKEVEIDEMSGEITEETKWPEYLEERVFTPAIHRHGDKFYSENEHGSKLGYVYEIGKVARLESWDQVNCQDGHKHLPGLHFGGLRYIQNYVREGREVLNAFICPSQIGRFTDSGIGEMACKSGYIWGAKTIDGITKGLYSTSTYDALRAKEIKEEIAKAAEQMTAIEDENKKKRYEVAELAKVLGL
ncbi:hypothetical protein [Tenacibaculum sp.]|uniref:hypothetical protein n=1 Tax=Tenacibaculum sp. TaxID=1906242 RepID=UPI003D0D5BEA